MAEPTSKFNDLSSETVTKLISILVAIVVFAVVLVPVVNGLADGDGDGGGGGSGGSDNVSDHFSMTMKDLYGESYPWTTVSGGYITAQNVPNLTITNPDFKQMPWETGQTTLDSNFNPAFWTVLENNGQIGYQLDLMALRDYYESYSQTLIDIYDVTFPNWSQDWYDGIYEVLPTYMLIMDANGNNNSEYLSPIGVGSTYDETAGAPILAYGFTDGRSITGVESNWIYSSAKMIFYYDVSSHISKMQYLSEYTWIDSNQQSHQAGDNNVYSIGAILFLGESDTGYMPLCLDYAGQDNLPFDNVTEYMTTSVWGGVISEEGITISVLNVADTVIHNVVDYDSGTIYPTMYDYTGQFLLNPEDYMYADEMLIFYQSSTDNTMDIDVIGWGWMEDDTYIVYEDESAIDSIIPYTLALTSPAEEGGGSGGTGGIGGTAGTIIKSLPIFVALGLIIGICSIFYTDPNYNPNFKKD